MISPSPPTTKPNIHQDENLKNVDFKKYLEHANNKQLRKRKEVKKQKYSKRFAYSDGKKQTEKKNLTRRQDEKSITFPGVGKRITVKIIDVKGKIDYEVEKRRKIKINKYGRRETQEKKSNERHDIIRSIQTITWSRMMINPNFQPSENNTYLNKSKRGRGKKRRRTGLRVSSRGRSSSKTRKPIGKRRVRRNNPKKIGCTFRKWNMAASKIQALIRGFIVRGKHNIKVITSSQYRKNCAIEKRKQGGRQKNLPEVRKPCLYEKNIKYSTTNREKSKEEWKNLPPQVKNKYDYEKRRGRRTNNFGRTYESSISTKEKNSASIKIQSLVRGRIGRLKYRYEYLCHKLNQLVYNTNEKKMNESLRAQDCKDIYREEIYSSHKSKELKEAEEANGKMDVITALEFEHTKLLKESTELKWGCWKSEMMNADLESEIDSRKKKWDELHNEKNVLQIKINSIRQNLENDTNERFRLDREIKKTQKQCEYEINVRKSIQQCMLSILNHVKRKSTDRKLVAEVILLAVQAKMRAENVSNGRLGSSAPKKTPNTKISPTIAEKLCQTKIYQQQEHNNINYPEVSFMKNFNDDVSELTINEPEGIEFENKIALQLNTIESAIQALLSNNIKNFNEIAPTETRSNSKEDNSYKSKWQIQRKNTSFDSNGPRLQKNSKECN